MSPTDRLAIVIYDDSVQTIVPSTPVENKEQLRSAIYSLRPGGSTNLFGGLEQGYAEARKNFCKDCVNRIVFLSDGLANVGVTDPRQIEAEAKLIRESGISVSSMGVGVDYNETLMANMADASGGNYYYISRETNMADVFGKEWNLMQSLVATNATAKLKLGKDVQVVDVAGYQWQQQANSVVIQVPDIYSGQTKRILVQLHVPATTRGTIDLGQGELSCTDLSSKQPQLVQLGFHPSIQVIQDRQMVDKNYDRDVRVKATSILASRKMDEAYKQVASGNVAAAQAANAEAIQILGEAPLVDAKDLEQQKARYQEDNDHLKAPMPADAPATQHFLKKQKEEERSNQQSDTAH